MMSSDQIRSEIRANNRSQACNWSGVCLGILMVAAGVAMLLVLSLSRAAQNLNGNCDDDDDNCSGCGGFCIVSICIIVGGVVLVCCSCVRMCCC